MTRLESWITVLLHVLQLLGIIIALFAVVVILLGIARSMTRVMLGSATLVLPFTGAAMAAPLNRILVEQIGAIEDEARGLYVKVLDSTAAGSDPGGAVDVGPLSGKALHEFVSGDGQSAIEHAQAYIAEEPVQLAAVSSLTFGGVTISPESMFAVSYFLRRRFARRTISGSLTEFDGTYRLALTFTGTGKGTGHEARRRAKGQAKPAGTPPVVVQRRTKSAETLLEIVDDIAFQLLRARYDLPSETSSWSAWVAFQRGYLDHVAFLTTGDRDRRIRSVKHYQVAVQRDPGLARAHYNLGSLLYDDYSLRSNQTAIQHFQAATESDNPTVKALAYAGLTMAYAQNVYRFELEATAWIEKADAASKASILLAPEMEEAVFARGWSLQISGRFQEAVQIYHQVVQLMGDTPREVQIKSFALNNEGYLYLNKLHQPDRAETLLLQAMKLRPNKNMLANLGELRRRQGRFAEALEYYREARRLDPMYTNGINETGMVYMSQASGERPHGAVRTQLVDQAYTFHLEALGTVHDRSEKQRVRRSFERHRRGAGIRGLHARRWSHRADRLVAATPQ